VLTGLTTTSAGAREQRAFSFTAGVAAENSKPSSSRKSVIRADRRSQDLRATDAAVVALFATLPREFRPAAGGR